MSEPVSPDRHSFGDDIQKRQEGIDDADTKRDARVHLEKLTDEQRDTVTAAYIAKVNAAQATIGRSFEKIDALKRARTEGWREWESQVIDASRDLASALSEEHYRIVAGTDEPNVVVERAAAFNAKVDAFLAKLETARTARETKTNEKLTPRAATDVLRGLDPRAIERYGEPAIRDLGVALKLYQSLPKKTAKELFGDAPPAIDEQIAGQLRNGTFERSPLAFLLEGSSAIEKRVATLREEKKDALAATQEELRTLEERTRAQLVRLCDTAKQDVANGAIESIVSWVLNLEGFPELQEQTVRAVRAMTKQSNALKEKATAMLQETLLLDVALRNADTTRAANAGNAALETQLRFASHVEFGLPFEPDDDQKKLLRPSQLATLEGKPDDALRLSIDEFNSFNAAHAEMDDLDRAELLGLSKTQRRTIGVLQSEDRAATSPNPFDRLLRGEARESTLVEAGRSELLFRNLPQRERVIRELGTIDGGNRLVLLELPGSKPEQMHTTVALKDPSGTVRLQNGATVERPRILDPLRVGVRGASGESMYTTPETGAFLERSMAGDPNARVVLRSNASIRTVMPSTSLKMDPVRILDMSQLQIVTSNKDGTVSLIGADGTDEGTIDAERLRTESAEIGSDVISAIDRHPVMQDVAKRAGELQSSMQGMQILLQTAMDDKATTSEAYVQQLHDYARPMQTILEDQSTKKNVMEAKILLQRELARCQTGDYVGRGVEEDIRDRIDALDEYVNVLDNQKLLHAVHTAMEVRPDTWAYWLSKEGLIMLAAITAAVVAIIALTIIVGIATGGAGLPAIPMLLLSAGVGTAAGIAGAEGAKEGLYLYHNTVGGAAHGHYRYADGSLVGNYARGQQIFDAETGRYVDMSLLKDVASPYAQEFIVGFAVTAATLGVVRVGGGALNKLAQNSKFVQAIAKNNGLANGILKRLTDIGDDVAKAPASAKEFARKVVGETIDELGDEAWEGGTEAVLNRIDTRLGFLASVIVGSAKGFKPLQGGVMSYPSTMSAADVETFALQQGHTVVSNMNGVLDVKTFDGKTLIFEPETVTADAKADAPVTNDTKNVEKSPKKTSADLLKKLESVPDAKFEVRANDKRIIVTMESSQGSGSVECIRHVSGAPLMIVESSNVSAGMGPLLYDLAMEAATEQGCMLVCDRKVVSNEALKLWQFYYKNRGDVESTELSPGLWNMGSHAEPYLGNMTEDRSTWPPKDDPIWALWSGFTKKPDVLTALQTQNRVTVVSIPSGKQQATDKRNDTAPQGTIGATTDAQGRTTEVDDDYLATNIDGTDLENAAAMSTNTEWSSTPIDPAFAFGPDLEQANVGNCYLVAAFNGMYHHPRFDDMMTASIRQRSDGCFEVSFPLGSDSPTQTVVVTREDIGSQRTDDEREELRPVTGFYGWPVLEAAFLKKKTGGTDRTKMEGGYGHEALVEMFGDTVEPEGGILAGGIAAARDKGDIPADMTDEYAREQIGAGATDFFDSFDPEHTIATINTSTTPSGKDTETFTVTDANGDEITLFKNHAYSIESVDRAAKTVVVKNPHDTSAAITLTYNQAIDAFSDISAVRFKQPKKVAAR